MLATRETYKQKFNSLTSMASIKELFDEIISDGVITREEHDLLMDEISKDGQIDQSESALISQIFEMIKSGKLIVSDSEREQAEAKRSEQILAELEKEKS